MDTLINILRQYPAIAIFLTVGIGFYVGKIKFKSFALGSVTAVLLTGLVIGQLDIPVSGQIKSVFFMMFLFSIGYSVGPKFFSSLRGSGLKQGLFALCVSILCFVTTMIAARLMAYNVGESMGLYSGAQTSSSLLGVSGDAISSLNMPDGEKTENLDLLTVCYAVTYIIGTLGAVIILGNFGPKLLGGIDKVKEQTSLLEAEMDPRAWENDPANIDAMRAVAFRSYVVENDYFSFPKSIKDTELYLSDNGLYVFIDRVERQGKIFRGTPTTMIHKGDRLVICGRREYMLDEPTYIGPEISDSELLSYPVEKVPVLVVRKNIDGLTVDELYKRRYMHGVVIRTVTRDGKNVEINPDTRLEKGDTFVLMGRSDNLKTASDHLGHMNRPTNTTDIMFTCLALAIGGFLGALSVHIGSSAVSFGTSGGALLSGLALGWIRSKRPTFGQIPDSALWLMNHLGLNVFIAIVGLQAAPQFVSGLQTVGVGILLAGVVVTSIPLLIALWLGHKVFKFNPAITLGCCAGARTSTPSLGAVQEAVGSTVPAMSYTIAYALSQILLVIWGNLGTLIQQ